MCMYYSTLLVLYLLQVGQGHMHVIQYPTISALSLDGATPHVGTEAL